MPPVGMPPHPALGQKTVEGVRATLAMQCEQEFSEIDTNRDNFADRAELEAIVRLKGPEEGMTVEQEVEGAFVNLDDNKDGLISREEFSRGMLKLFDAAVFQGTLEFDKLDTNNDGFVDRDECRNLLLSKGAPEAGVETGIDTWISEFDQNSDGLVSKEEMSYVFAKQIAAKMFNDKRKQ